MNIRLPYASGSGGFEKAIIRQPPEKVAQIGDLQLDISKIHAHERYNPIQFDSRKSTYLSRF